MARKAAAASAEEAGGSPDGAGRKHSLPDHDTCRAVLSKMLLIRHFEERAGEMYAKAKIGGFLHLCIGEEATVVGATQAMRDGDYLLSTYREHGQALAHGVTGVPTIRVGDQLFWGDDRLEEAAEAIR